jgi:HEAT repeat protein
MVVAMIAALMLTLTVGASSPPQSPDVAFLKKQLMDPDELVRLKAAKVLGTLGASAKDALSALEFLTKDDDEDVRYVATQAITKIKAALKVVEETDAVKSLSINSINIVDSDKDVRAKAASELTKLLRSSDPLIRSKAAQALSLAGIEGEIALVDLRALTKDEEPLVRQEARKALTNIEAALAKQHALQVAERLQPLLERLGSFRPNERDDALRELSAMGEEGKGATEAVLQLLFDPRRRTDPTTVLSTLEKIHPQIHDDVATLVLDKDPRRKAEAVSNLGRMGSEAKDCFGLIFYLLKMSLTSDEPGLRALRGLDMGGSYSRSNNPFLGSLRAIDPTNPELVKFVLETVTSRGSDPRQFLRDQAIKMMMDMVNEGSVEPKIAVQRLITLIHEPRYTIEIIDLLGSLHEEATEALPSINKYKFHSVKEVRDAAARAIKSIQQP